MTRLCSSCNTHTGCFIKLVRLCCNVFEIVLQCVRDCVRLQKRVSFMCAALRTRAGEDVSCTKVPKHQSTGRQCTSAPNAVHQDSAHQSRGVQSGCSAPRNPHPPSSSFPPTAFCWARSAQSLRIKNPPQHLLRWELSAYHSLPQPESLSSFSFSFFLTLAALEGRILIEIRKIGEA